MNYPSLLLILVSQVLAFDFMSQSLQTFLQRKSTDPYVIIYKDIIKERIYETELMNFWPQDSWIPYFNFSEDHPIRQFFAGFMAGHQYTEVQRRIITARSDGTLGNLLPAKPEGSPETYLEYYRRTALENARGVKKPVRTRVGQLLMMQHTRWMRRGDSFNRVNNVEVVRKKLTLAENNDKRLNLFIQVLLIFGFFDLSNPAHCQQVIQTVENSSAYKTFVKDPKTFILPNIDYIISLLVHDPRMQEFRKDEWSTLRRFKLSDYLFSEADQLVADFIHKVIGYENCTPDMLFTTRCKKYQNALKA